MPVHPANDSPVYTLDAYPSPPQFPRVARRSYEEIVALPTYLLPFILRLIPGHGPSSV